MCKEEFDIFSEVEKTKKIINENFDATKVKRNLINRVNALIDIQERIKQSEEKLASLQKVERDLSGIDIPLIMEELQIEEFKLLDGPKITIKEKLKCTLTKANLEDGYQFLTEKGYQDSFKHGLKFSGNRGNLKTITEITATIRDEFDIGFKQETSIHYQTLNKIAREFLEKGEKLPEKTFNIFQYKETKITN